MGWIIFMLLAWTAALIFVPIKNWKKSWPIGVLGMASIYAIDSTLIYLGAFKFWHGGMHLSGLPLYYWVSYFPGGIIFDYLRPRTHIWRALYILITAAILLIIELIMIYFGYFQYFNWNAFRSYLLNVGGFTVSMWYAEWLDQGWDK